ncbi:MAG: D-alanine--D-alanine ligase [bacterium]
MVIILKGGNSSERQVSLWTAQSVATVLIQLGEEYREIDAADTDWLEQVVALKPRIVVIALHGPFGEDGTVQGLLAEKGIAFTGSDSASSRFAIDKTATKKVVEKLGIKVPFSVAYSGDEPVTWEHGFPAVVKPDREGSSFGVTIVKDASALDEAVKFARSFGVDILVEEFIKGTELTCGVIDVFGTLQALPLVEIRPKHEFFNFEAKYTPGESEDICPAPVSKEVSDRVQQETATIYKEMGLRQYARADWMLSEDGTPYFIEINTLPGMTKTSLLPMELPQAGISYEEFIAALIRVAD